jgi:hypothetical protein
MLLRKQERMPGRRAEFAKFLFRQGEVARPKGVTEGR